MPGTPVKIGPFTGGINLYSDPTSIDDTDVVECLNLDIDLDGSLVNRPPLGQMPGVIPGAVGGTVFLAYFITASNVIYIVVRNTGTNQISAFDVNGVAPAYNITFMECVAAVQYQNKLWLVATTNSGTSGGKWDPAGGYVAVPTMARGTTAMMYKERLFIGAGIGAANPNRVNFSAPANLDSWTPATDYFDVRAGDGQFIIRLYNYQGYIVVFKNNSTFTFGYDTAPSRGQVQVVSGTIGINSLNAFAEFENIMYVMSGDYLYSIQNWNWTILNIKVPFQYYRYKSKTTTEDFTVSVVGNRLICRYYDAYYIFGLRTRAFTVWLFNLADYSPSGFYQYPAFDTTTSLPLFICDNYDKSTNQWFKMIDTITAPTGLKETFNVALTTKTYDYAVAYNFKRLFWWGVDCLAKSTLTFYVRPTAYNIPVTWGQLKAYKWSQLKTWGRPIDSDINVTDSASSANPSGIRTFIKVLMSLRFRQVSFRVLSTVDGTAQTGPFRIFSLVAFTSSKAKVSRKIS